MAGEDELCDLIAVVRGVTSDRILRSKERERVSDSPRNDQRTQTLHNVRRGNPV
jgi:hypothetical protein